MGPGVQLMNLSDELLLEIVARVPFKDYNWSNLSCVNRRFNQILSTKALPVKAAVIQFNTLNKLLPLCELNQNPLRGCRRFARGLPCRPALLAGSSRQLVLLHLVGRLLYFTIMLHMRGIETGDLQGDRCKLYNLRLLRLFPLETHAVIRYTALIEFEGRLTDRHSRMLIALPSHAPEEEDAVLLQVYSFLRSEDMFHVFPIYCPTRNRKVPMLVPWADTPYSVRFHNEALSYTRLPMEHSGRYLPGATSVASILARRFNPPHPFSDIPSVVYRAPPDLRKSFTGNARREALQQLGSIRQLIYRLESDNGEYAGQLLDSLDLRAIRSIIYQQAEASKVVTEEEMDGALQTELEVLVGSDI